MVFKIGNVKIKNKGVLAPILEYTNLPFRLLCKEYNCALTYTEMVHTNHIVSLKDNIESIGVLKSNNKDTPTSIQLVGNFLNKKELFSAINLIDNYKYFDIIDLNLGCPSKRIISLKSGSYLLNKIDELVPIIKEITSITNKPITIKTRLGFSKNNIEYISKKLINCNIDALCIHGRTAQENYAVPSNYKAVENVAKDNNIPIIYNGDINLENLYKFVNNNYFSGIMIARTSISNPSIFKNISKNNFTKNYKNISELLFLFKKYYSKHNIKLNIKKITLLSFISGFKNSSNYRNQISNCKNNQELDNIINNLIDQKI